MDGRVIDLHVVLVGFEIGQDSVDCTRIRHDLLSAVNEPLLVDLLKDIPNALHKVNVESFVVIVKVNPPSKPIDGLAPLGAVFHDDAPTLGVVFVYTHFEHLALVLDFE